MSHIKILAVEDDPIHAESLALLVAEMGYELIALVDNSTDALNAAKQTPPDLILMDIEINDVMSGIELAARLKKHHNVPVIYVTSHKDKGAFQRAMLTLPDAFIVKPYVRETLQAAIELALMRGHGVATKDPAPIEESFYVKDKGSLYKINPLDILFIEADEKYCTINTRERKYTINIRLKELHDRLSPAAFVQTHRSFLIRKDNIEKINPADQVVIVAGKEIPIGKSFKDDLFGMLNRL